jgi:hypothetical protein
VTYVHVSLFPKTPAFDNPKNPTPDEWLKRAVAWYEFQNSYYEKTDEQQAQMARQHKWLKATMPEEYREGVHLLAREGGFMGEDVYAVDGDLGDTLHVYCKACAKPEVVWRRTEDGWGKWCVPCGVYVEVVPDPPTQEECETPDDPDTTSQGSTP